MKIIIKINSRFDFQTISSKRISFFSMYVAGLLHKSLFCLLFLLIKTCQTKNKIADLLMHDLCSDLIIIMRQMVVSKWLSSGEQEFTYLYSISMWLTKIDIGRQ